MQDQDLLQRIATLIARQHEIRERRAAGSLDEGTERGELHAVQVELDQSWDLLRQRQAREEFGQDPEETESRPESIVENYWQ